MSALFISRVFAPLSVPLSLSLSLHAGFGVVGIPENLIRALKVTGPKFLTVVSNEAG